MIEPKFGENHGYHDSQNSHMSPNLLIFIKQKYDVDFVVFEKSDDIAGLW